MEELFRDLGFDVSLMQDVIEIILNTDKRRVYDFEDKTYYAAIIDDSISVWFSDSKDDDGEDGAIVEYTCGNEYDVLTPENVENTAHGALVRLRFEGVSYPIDVQLVCEKMAVEFKEDVQYVANVACFALKLECYETILDYSTAQKDLNIYAVYNIGHSETNTAPVVAIKGVIKDFKLKTNPYTQKKYYHLDVETFEKTFVILAEESFVPSTVYAGMIISALCYCTAAVTEKSGESYNYDFDESTVADAFINEISGIIVSLRNLPYEHVCVSFSQDTQTDNITFLQTANYGTHYMLEIGKTIEGRNHLFRLSETELQNVLKMFYSICVKKTAPDISDWEDVTYLIENEE